MGIGCAGEARARRVVRPTRYSWRREVHTVGRPNHTRWLLGAVLASAATLAVPGDGKPKRGGTPAQGAQSQSQGAGAAPPFDLKDEAVVKQGATLFATTCSYCHKGHPGAGGAGVPTLRDQTYDKEDLYRMISDGPPSGRMAAGEEPEFAPENWKA